MVQPSKLHPENKDEVKEIEITSDVETFISEMNARSQEERSERANWENAVDRLDALRYGVRKKKIKPWFGAANYSIPLIDSDITKLKPMYVNAAYGVSPVVTFVPYGPEDVEPMRLREQLFDWRMRTQVQFFKPYNYGIDLVLGAPGQTVFRTIWNFSSRKYNEVLDIEDLPAEVIDVIYDVRVTDDMLAQIIIEEFKIDTDYDENITEVNKAIQAFRNGKTNIDMSLLETENNQPEVSALDVREELVVPSDTRELQDALFIDYPFWKSINELKIEMADGKYQDYSEDDIKSWAGKGTNYSSEVSDEMVLCHELCCWYDIDGDGIEEKCIATYPDADPQSVLRFIGLPYKHGLWPYAQVKRELTKPGFYQSRGIPSLDEDFQVGISTSVNQSIDNGTILNSPERVYKRGVISNPKNRRYVPGENIEVNGDISQVQTRVVGNVTQGVLFQNAQYLKSWSVERLGQVTSGLGSQSELSGSGERGKKTAAEVDALIAVQGQAQSLDLQIFQQQMADVYYQIDALYDQYGDDEEEILITGKQPQKVSRQDIQGRFNIIPNGRLDNSTPALRLQKTMVAMQIGMGSPWVKDRVLIEEAFKDLGSRLETALKTEEEIAQEQQAQAQAIAEAEAKELQKGFGVKKVSDDLDVRKAILMEPIQGKKYAPG